MDKETFEKGLAIRRRVLGADSVNRALETADDFNRPMQDLVTEYCWGEIWGRPGLPPKTRSLLNLAMLSALNRPHEIKAHVRGAPGHAVMSDAQLPGLAHERPRTPTPDELGICCGREELRGELERV